MTLLHDRRRLIVSPALAPAQMRETYQLDDGLETTDGVLTIGLINNMPDGALQSTERQFMRLLTAAAGNNHMAALAAVSAHTVKGEVAESADAFQVFAQRFEKAVESHAAIAERFQGTAKPN